MSEKMSCPACESCTSSVLQAFEFGEPCPTCGLPASAAAEVERARERGANEELTAKYTDAIIRAEKAEGEARTLRNRLTRIRRALDEDA